VFISVVSDLHIVSNGKGIILQEKATLQLL
jgi:hypothetical protein